VTLVVVELDMSVCALRVSVSEVVMPLGYTADSKGGGGGWRRQPHHILTVFTYPEDGGKIYLRINNENPPTL
jgi:hypothetical protein